MSLFPRGRQGLLSLYKFATIHLIWYLFLLFLFKIVIFTCGVSYALGINSIELKICIDNLMS